MTSFIKRKDKSLVCPFCEGESKKISTKRQFGMKTVKCECKACKKQFYEHFNGNDYDGYSFENRHCSTERYNKDGYILFMVG